MKKTIIISYVLLLCLILVGCSFNNSAITKSTAQNHINSTNESSFYESEKTAINKPIEKTLYTFSTNILDKDAGRQTNIEITCSVLNGTVVKAGEIFSFCDTVGKATPERGYEEAKVFDSNGEVTMGYGGGNCQVSSTLYNVILQDSNFEIVERHPHSQTVYYVEERKRCSCCMW